jgi:hypothetical protein
MAQFTRVNGDFQPLMNYDADAYTNAGVNAITSGATVQPAGPKLAFGTVTFTGAATPTGADLAIAFQTIEQLSTVMMYEFTEVGDNTDTLALAIYPVGAWDFTNAGSLDVALTAALGYAVTTAATATFTN